MAYSTCRRVYALEDPDPLRPHALSPSSSAGGGGTSPMKVPISAIYIVQNNNYIVNSLNNLIKQVKECVRINFILIKKDNKMKLY